MIPEVFIRETLLSENIDAFTIIDDFNKYDEFVLIVRTGSNREALDTNNVFKNKVYDFSLQCFSTSLSGAAVLVEEVSDIFEDAFFNNDEIADINISGGSLLPEIDGKYGYTVGLNLTIQ